MRRRIMKVIDIRFGIEFVRITFQLSKVSRYVPPADGGVGLLVSNRMFVNILHTPRNCMV